MPEGKGKSKFEIEDTHQPVLNFDYLNGKGCQYLVSFLFRGQFNGLPFRFKRIYVNYAV